MLSEGHYISLPCSSETAQQDHSDLPMVKANAQFLSLCDTSQQHSTLLFIPSLW
jgi:hypothetical protein